MAPPAPVVAHLRQPGMGTPGRGRGAPIPDTTAGRRLVAERHRREREELNELLGRFAERGAVRLSQLSEVDECEFMHLRAWISRAYEAPAHEGTRTLVSSDGRAAIKLAEPGDGARVTLATPLGRLEMPDYRLEVARR